MPNASTPTKTSAVTPKPAEYRETISSSFESQNVPNSALESVASNSEFLESQAATRLVDFEAPNLSSAKPPESAVQTSVSLSRESDVAPVLAALRGEDISVGYGDRLIIEPMNVEIPVGQVTTIIGSNGCGKSTLLKALARILPVRSGAVYLNGEAIAKMSSTEIARQMALLPQSPEAPSGLTVSELVAYGRYPHQRGFGRLTSEDKEFIDQALSMTFMSEFADRPLDELSGGQRQRAWIAMALAQDTDVILLDEPTTYLDLSHQLEVLELLRNLNREQGKTVALVIHELNLAARYADWMIAMKDGAVAYLGTPEEVMTPAMMRDIFSLDALITTDPWTHRPSVISSRLLK